MRSTIRRHRTTAGDAPLGSCVECCPSRPLCSKSWSSTPRYMRSASVVIPGFSESMITISPATVGLIASRRQYTKPLSRMSGLFRCPLEHLVYEGLDRVGRTLVNEQLDGRGDERKLHLGEFPKKVIREIIHYPSTRRRGRCSAVIISFCLHRILLLNEQTYNANINLFIPLYPEHVHGCMILYTQPCCLTTHRFTTLTRKSS
jgi:hypothetical protein